MSCITKYAYIEESQERKSIRERERESEILIYIKIKGFQIAITKQNFELYNLRLEMSFLSNFVFLKILLFRK